MRSIEGQGTRFSLDIPRSDEARDRTVTKESQQTAILKDLGGLYAIYVEDDALVRASTEALFEEYGILYEAVGSMQELRERLALMERLPDVVISDHRLPGGWTAKDVAEIVSGHLGATIPVVIITGEVMTHATELAGAQVLAKPVAPEALLAAIAASCQRQPELA